MKKIFQFLALLVCCSIFFACKKDYPELDFKLPEATKSGDNTIGFVKNNKVWVNYGQYCAGLFYCPENLDWTARRMEAPDSAEFGLWVHAYKFIREKENVKTKESFMMSKVYINGLGEYIIDRNNSGQRDLAELQDDLATKRYVDNAQRVPFKINITKLDTVNQIMSGNFSGVLYNEKNVLDSVVIESGRFDFKMSSY